METAEDDQGWEKKNCGCGYVDIQKIRSYFIETKTIKYRGSRIPRNVQTPYNINLN